MKSPRIEGVQVRALPEEGEGVVEAYVTVSEHEYQVGFLTREVIARGAFQDSLAERSALPIYAGHDWRTGGVPIGVTQEVREDEKGLLVRAQLWVEDDPKARAVWRSLKAGALREWSIGFSADEVTTREDGDTTVEVITRGTLLEASVVMVGANDATETVAVRDQAPEPEVREEEPEAEESAPEPEAHDALDLSQDWQRDLLAP